MQVAVEWRRLAKLSRVALVSFRLWNVK